MLKIVAVKSLKPNPYRRLDEYPILREKVDALKESIESTGFWGTIVGRPNGTGIEIAFGHHRLVALREAGRAEVEMIVRELSNEQMILMMAKENMEEWGTSAWVELETIRAVIEAYGKGEIKLPKVSKNTDTKHIREVDLGSDPLPYTQTTVAMFLGWTKKHRDNGLLPNSACEVAFRALDMIEAGFLDESDLKGLLRDQMRTLVEGQWSIYQSEMRAAKADQEEAKQATKRAAAAKPEEREVFEKRAKVYTSQAEQHKTDAKAKAKDFGKSGAESFRQGAGVRDVKNMAMAAKTTVEQPAPTHDVDDLVHRIAAKLHRIANGDDDLSGDMALLRKCTPGDVSERAAQDFCQTSANLRARLERFESTIMSFTRSH